MAIHSTRGRTNTHGLVWNANTQKHNNDIPKDQKHAECFLRRKINNRTKKNIYLQTQYTSK